MLRSWNHLLARGVLLVCLTLGLPFGAVALMSIGVGCFVSRPIGSPGVGIAAMVLAAICGFGLFCSLGGLLSFRDGLGLWRFVLGVTARLAAFYFGAAALNVVFHAVGLRLLFVLMSAWSNDNASLVIVAIVHLIAGIGVTLLPIVVGMWLVHHHYVHVAKWGLSS